MSLADVHNAGVAHARTRSKSLAEADVATNHIDLVARCRELNAQAWTELYRTHVQFVRRAALRLGTADSELDDVCQDTFLIAFRKIDRFQNGSFSAWICAIANKIVADRRRRARYHEAVHLIWPDQREYVQASPEEQRCANEVRALVQLLLTRISPKKREVLMRLEIKGFTATEVASCIGCKLETVRTRLHYARKDFRRLAVKHFDRFF